MVAPTDGVQSPQTGSLAPDERAELERLRTEVEALRERPPRNPRHFWRWTLATVLIVLGSLLAPLAVTAVWVNSQISDTDRYVATVAPLARDPALQRAVTDRITTEIFNRIDIEAITNQAADALSQRGVPDSVGTALHGLATPIANGVQGWVHDQVGRLVASDEFAQAWAEANRAAHAQLVSALTGNQSGALVVQGETVSVRLATFIEAVKQRLIANGFTIAEKIPEVNAEFVIFESADVVRAQRAFRLLDTLGTWLPIIALVLLAAAVLAAPGKRRALIGAALGVALGMVLLGGTLAILRPLYLNAVPGSVLPTDAAAAVFDQIVTYLRTALRTVLAVALIVLAAAYLSGPSTAAVATRRAVGRGIAYARGGAGRLGLRTGPVGVWVGRHKRPLRWGTVALAVAVFVFWNYPTVGVAVAIALCALLVLVLIELIAAPDEPKFREQSRVGV
jgi:hypothetical protein